MTITLRPSDTRGHADHGWLNTKHSFSFADYYDPRQMGFRSLRVINDDRIRGGGGFPTHGHRDMEIVTYVTEGALAHRDTTGASGKLGRGDVQAMTAGTGIRHSEFNATSDEDLRLLQIWILPEREGLAPAYAQTHFTDEDKRNRLRLLASDKPSDGGLQIRQDARIYAAILDAGKSVTHHLDKGRGAWIQIVDGALDVNGRQLNSGDGAAIEDADLLTLSATSDVEFLLFDLG